MSLTPEAPARGYPEPVTTLISFPFRLTPGGTVATRDDADDRYLSEQLALLIRTQPGERTLVPLFGLADPAFDRLDEGALATQILLFGPPLVVESVEIVDVSDQRQDVVVSFRGASEQEAALVGAVGVSASGEDL